MYFVSLKTGKGKLTVGTMEGSYLLRHAKTLEVDLPNSIRDTCLDDVRFWQSKIEGKVPPTVPRCFLEVAAKMEAAS